MKLSRITQIISEEIQKVFETEDHYSIANDKFSQMILGKKKDEDKPFKTFRLPSLSTGDATTTMDSIENVENWHNEFLNKFGEEPTLKKIENKIEVTNPKFIEWKNQYINTKASELEKYKNKD